MLKSTQAFQNPYVQSWELSPSERELLEAAWAFHRGMAGYCTTPLVQRDDLAREVKCRSVLVKDESNRFGLNAFKVLGASFGVGAGLDADAQERVRSGVFCAATDGNHGRAVAWIAARLGRRCEIFVPRQTVAARIEAIRREGAAVTVVDGDYDAAVAGCAREAATNGWTIISDMGYPGYEKFPARIAAGYTTLFREVDDVLGGEAPPDVVVLQAGCGGFASAACLYYTAMYGARRPKLICAEPLDAMCCMASIRSERGELRSINGADTSIMAGLNCGTPSSVAWPILRRTIDGFIAFDDEYAREAMRLLAGAPEGKRPIVAGESGAAGLGALLASSTPECAEWREQLGVGERSCVLVINTEGATDPESYEKIVSASARSTS